MITIPSISDILKVLRGTLNGLLPEIVVTPDSDAGVRNRMLAEALLGLFVELRNIEYDIIPSARTSTEGLELHAEARLGPSARKGPTVASGTDALKVYGTEGTKVEAGETLAHTDGTRYQITAGGIIGAAPDEWVLCDVESIDKGSAANRAVGDVLTFEAAPTGVSANADVVAAISGGYDQESDGELLARLFDAYRNPPAGGRMSDYRQWAQAVDSVLWAYVYGPSSVAQTGRRGIGIIDVAIVQRGTGSGRIPPASVQSAVFEYIEARRSVCLKDWAVLLPTASAQDIDIKVSPKTGYEWDFGDETSGSTVSIWNSSTLELTWSSSIDDDCAAGDRILVAGQLNTVKSIDTATKMTLESGFDTNPTGGESIYPAGPLTEPLQTAIKAYMDGLGPARGVAADPEQDWDDVLRLASLYDIVMDVEGVKDCEVVTPSANVTPTDGAPSGSVQLLVYDEIVVRPL